MKYLTMMCVCVMVVCAVFNGAFAATGDPDTATNEESILDNNNLPSPLFGAGDPEIVSLYNWVMFFNAERTGESGVNIYQAWLDYGDPLNSARGSWNVSTTPLVQKPEDDWDDIGIETPSFVYGYDSGTQTWESRIYYTGYVALDGNSDVCIGYLWWDTGASCWKRHGDPVLTGTETWEKWKGYSFVIEPCVRYFDNTWHMWYAAGDYSEYKTNLCHATSSDGRTWSNRAVVWPGSTYIFNVDVRAVGSHYELFAGICVYPTESQNGIWWARSDTPSGDYEDWTNWTQVLAVDSGAMYNGHEWHQLLAFSPSFQYISADEKWYVFFRALDDWNRANIGRFESSPQE